MKSLPLIIFGIAALAQWAAPLSQIWTHEQVLAKGTLIKLKCHAPDPYDPLRGRYLAVWPEPNEISQPKELKLTKGMQFFASLITGSDGLATLGSASLSPPASGDYIRLKVRYANDSMADVEWPFNRFYVNEKLAPEADKWFAQNTRTEKGVIAEVRVLHGRAVLEDLSFDGRPFREILKERVK